MYERTCRQRKWVIEVSYASLEGAAISFISMENV